MIRVKATREGLIGHTTASGYVIDAVVPFVALPARAALHRFVRLFCPQTNRHAMAVVLDVGPWNTDDEAYVTQGARPQAEQGKDKRGRPTNGAGIDLSQRIWRELELTDNGEVDWEFIE